ncbi:hypothetical protein [Streptomyces scabiei]|uniref:hypothetical protein n=1 Tax=Streptomyces scabiei TaxID=1930 RepID=UPI0029B587C9|nr:hypothetical protein [Streptomyces scabiei]MDX3117838.1 hypothetical protein [Streptomyces scabiei]
MEALMDDLRFAGTTLRVQLKARLTTPPYRPVAHHASTEVGITARQAEHCPVLAATPLLDTLRLAKAVVPGMAPTDWTACSTTTASPSLPDGTGPRRMSRSPLRC